MIVESFVAFVALALALVSLLQNLSGKKKFWEQYGITTLKLDNILIRSLKGWGFVEADDGLYKQLEDAKYGGVHESGYNVVFLKDLEIAKQIFVKEFDHFINRRSVIGREKSWNDMMFNKADKDWKDMRSVMTPTFTTGKIRRMFPLLEESAKKFVQYVSVIADKNGQMDVNDALGRYCMDGICSIAFGIDCQIFENENSIVAQKANKLELEFNPVVFFRVFLGSMMPKWARVYPSMINPDSNQFFVKLILDTIERREKSGERRNDFIQIMLDAKKGRDDDETESKKDVQLNSEIKNEAITNDVIVANCITFILGGFDTTKSAVIFAAFSLATNPDVQEKLRNELQNAIDDNGGDFSYDMSNTHEYLDKVANETMRLYPPATRLERLCNEDYAIPNTNALIPKGSLVWIPAYNIHHDKEHFPNPEQFDPERFSPEGKASRHSYAFMPFGHGPRNCIANRFAMVQTKALIAHLVLNFHIETTNDTIIPIKFATKSSLRPSHPVYLKLTPIK